MHEQFTWRSILGSLAVGVVVATGTLAVIPTVTQAQAPSQPTDAQLLEDFNFYVITANIELAKANAQALLDRGLTPAQFVGIVEDSVTMQERFDRAYRRALVIAELEGVAAELQQLYERGRLERARDPEEIARNIALLNGAPRAQVLGRQRIAYAGEYAIPQLLEVLLDRKDQTLQTEVAALLVSMGRQSVTPLSVALLGVDPATQETIARILGRIQYTSARPYLTELYRTTDSTAVRAAAANAIELLGIPDSPDISVAGLYRDLAEEYYKEPRSLTSFPTEQYQLLWDFDPSIGLNPTAIDTEVFHEAMAMRLAEKALALDPSDQQAISLWLASNFSRELDQPENYDNPAYPTDGPGARRDAMYYAVAAGADTTQQVLARALADRDTPLARKAIEALSRSAGVAGLVGPQGVPLVEALSYPDRRVRYEAALALGRAKPRTAFEGAERIVPTLASIIGEGSKRYAVVLATELERQQSLRAVLEGQGYIVLPPQTSLDAASQSISDAPGIDLLVTDLATDTTIETIAQARRTARLQATPLLAFLSSTGLTQYGGQFDSDRLTQLARHGISDAQFGEAVRMLVEDASGEPMTEAEAESYASGSLNVLHDLAIASGGSATDSAVLNINDASIPLIASLGETTGGLKLQVADVLSYIGQQRAQVALMDAVMASSGPERLALMSKVNNSAKRFGNLLEDRQVRWLVDIAENGTDEEATLGAALIGALNLPNAKLVPLIIRADR